MKNKTLSLCNIPFTSNKKGRSLFELSPKFSPLLSSVLDVPKDKAGETILVIFFLITKTVQMYEFI